MFTKGKLYLWLINHNIRKPCFCFSSRWHTKSLIDVTRHCYILFVCSKKFLSWGSCLNLCRNMERCCQRPHLQTVQWVWRFYRGSMTVITCFEMPLGFFWILMALKLCWYFSCVCQSNASLPSPLFLLILAELGLWKVLPSLIRCCHCVEKPKLV